MEDLNKLLQENLALLGIGTVGLSTFVYTAWEKIKQSLHIVWGFVFIEIEFSEIYRLRESLLLYLFQNYTLLDRSRKLIHNTYIYSYKYKQSVIMPLMYNKPTVFYKRGRILFHKNGVISTLRLFFNTEKFIKEIYDLRYKVIENTEATASKYKLIKVFGTKSSTGIKGELSTPMESDRKPKSEEVDYNGDVEGLPLKEKLSFMKVIGHSLEEISLKGYNSETYIPEENYFVNAEQQNIIDKLDLFLKNSDWFMEKHLSYTFGANLYGGPGTGKTSFIRYIARKFDLPIVLFDLSSMDNQDFVNEYKAYAHGYYPYIIVFEDFDNIFHGRKNITVKNKSHNESSLTFDCLLNTISGIADDQRTILFITTNDISKIDPALGIPDINDKNLSTRPNRIDYVCYFGPMEKEGRMKVIKKILHDTDHDMEKVLIETEGQSAAQVTSKCKELALDYFHRVKMGKK